MRALWSGLILLGFLLPKAEAAIPSGDSGARVAAMRIVNSLRSRCSDGVLQIRPLVRRVQDLRMSATGDSVADGFRVEKEFSTLLLSKTRCSLDVMAEVLGREYRMVLLSDGPLKSELSRMKDDHQAIQESNPSAKAMVMLLNDLDLAVARAVADEDYMTLGGYAVQRVREVERRIEFFADGLRPGGPRGTYSTPTLPALPGGEPGAFGTR